jgi:hypothetical protein
LDYEQNRPVLVTRRSATNPGWTSNTWAFLGYDTNEKDTESGHSTSTNSHRYTAATAGWYWFGIEVSWNGNVTGGRAIAITLNNATATGNNAFAASSNTADSLRGGGKQFQDCGGMVALNAGDWVSVEAFQDSGVGASLLAANLINASYTRLYGILLSKL